MVPSTLDMVPSTLDKVPSTLDPRQKDTLLQKQPKMMNLFTASDNCTTTSTTLPLKSQKPCQPKAQDNSKLPKVTVKFGTTEVRMLIGTQALV